MKLCFSILVTAVGLAAAAAEPDNVETSRKLRDDPLNNLRGGWPTPSSVRYHGTPIPTDFHWPGTQIPTPDSWPGTQIPTHPSPGTPTGSPTQSPTDHPVTPAPTGSPINPTHSPTDHPVTPAPTGSLINPTSTPSFFPSVSLSPTETCGPAIENYSKMGKGRCLDGDGVLFNLVLFNNIASAHLCGTKCNCASQFLTVQGFDYNSDDEECMCLVDESSNLSSAVTTCSPAGQNTSRVGFGKVINTNTNNSFCCFRNDLTSAAPSVSLAPSTTIKPSTSSAPSNSLAPTLAPSVSLLPTETCGPTIENYSKMGKGRCLDGDGALFNLVLFNNIASARECAEKCNCASQSLTVQGFDYNSDDEECMCLVDESNNLSSAVTTCSPAGQNTSREGFGKVINTNTNDSFCCFRNDLTSAAPSESLAPSTSLMPSISLVPSQSSPPTEECGPSIENYTKMGKGECLDGDDAPYSFVRFDDVASSEECAEKCNCASQSLTVQGFDYNAQIFQNCRCLVHEKSNLNVCGRDGRYVNNAGFGRVTSTNGNPGVCCFRNELTSAAPSVSHAPSASIVPSVSTAPSRELKTGKSCNGDAQCRSGCCREEYPGEGKVCIKLNHSNNYTCPDR